MIHDVHAGHPAVVHLVVEVIDEILANREVRIGEPPRGQVPEPHHVERHRPAGRDQVLRRERPGAVVERPVADEAGLRPRQPDRGVRYQLGLRQRPVPQPHLPHASLEAEPRAELERALRSRAPRRPERDATAVAAERARRRLRGRTGDDEPGVVRLLDLRAVHEDPDERAVVRRGQMCPDALGQREGHGVVILGVGLEEERPRAEPLPEPEPERSLTAQEVLVPIEQEVELHQLPAVPANPRLDGKRLGDDLIPGRRSPGGRRGVSPEIDLVETKVVLLRRGLELGVDRRDGQPAKRHAG